MVIKNIHTAGALRTCCRSEAADHMVCEGELRAPDKFETVRVNSSCATSKITNVLFVTLLKHSRGHSKNLESVIADGRCARGGGNMAGTMAR